MPPPERRSGPPPAYMQVAEDLLARIDAGEFPPGHPIPSEAALIEHYRVSATPIRNAVRHLAAMGVVRGRHGVGTFVTSRNLLQINATHTEDLDRREGVTAQDSWSTDVLAAGFTPHQRFECLFTAPTAEMAEEFEVGSEASLVLRRCWRYVDEEPSSVESSFFPQWVTALVPRLQSPHDIPQGTTSYLAEQGHPMLWHQDALSARPPTQAEAGFFDVSIGVATLIRYRTSYDKPGGRVMRIMETIYRGDRYKVVYDVAGKGNVVYANGQR